MGKNKIDYRCSICGSRDVGYEVEAYDEWNVASQRWESPHTGCLSQNGCSNRGICNRCRDCNVTLVEVPVGDKLLIGLGFQKRTGKDTAADILVEEHGFVKRSFAAPLKELAEIVLWIERDSGIADGANFIGILEYWMEVYGQLDSEVFDKIINLDFGVDKDWLYRVDADGKYRHLLQFLGTDLIRNSNANYWVDAMFHQDLPERVVISDMRFLNEMDAISARGGLCVKITRDFVVAEDAHISENELSESLWDFRIDNDYTIDSLADEMDELVNYLVVDDDAES